VLNLRPLKDVLWEAQGGKCWLCERRMIFHGGTLQNSCTVDHVWPKGIFGKNGNTGICLLACRSCNNARGDVYPTDDEIRAFVRIWRKVDPSWLLGNLRLLRKALASAQREKVRAEILNLFATAPLSTGAHP
jgi:hypothetical protein